MPEKRLALEADLAWAVAVVAFRVALAVPGAASVGHFDIGQVLLQEGQLLVHRHTVILPTIADLDPPDHSGLVHPPRAEHFAQVAVREALAETPVFQSPQEVGSSSRSNLGSQQISHD